MATEIIPKEQAGLLTFEAAGLGDMERDMYTHEQHHKDILHDGSKVEALIIGGGLHGLVNAHRLVTSAGLKSDDVVLVDKAGGWGGTWYWNRYPGVMCDVEGYSYLPLLEETGHVPKKRYSDGYEIHEQCVRIAEKWNLRGQFLTTVIRQEWDDSCKAWKVTMERASKEDYRPNRFTVTAKWLICSSHIFASAQVPFLNGPDIFRSSPSKHLMHTAMWDWNVSGGSPASPEMTKLKDKVVGVVGTGATALQVIPRLAPWVKHLYVFQRTPAYVGPHFQEKTTPELWEKVAYKKGWQHERMVNAEALMDETEGWTDIVRDGWSDVLGIQTLTGSSTKVVAPGEEEKHSKYMLKRDAKWTANMRKRVVREVNDPELAEKLTPWAPSFCKRPAFHNEYLKTFNRPNVTLVNAKGGVTAYTEKGIIANDQEHELDMLVLATGYATSMFDNCPSSGATKAPIIGKQGRTLEEKWDSKDFGTFMGVATNGFPNMFFFTTAGTAMSVNFNAVVTNNARLISEVIRSSRERASSREDVVVEVKKEAEDEWTDLVASRARWYSLFGLCDQRHGSKSLEEMKDEGSLRRSIWGGGIMDYRRRLDEWEKEGELRGFEVESA